MIAIRKAVAYCEFLLQNSESKSIVEDLKLTVTSTYSSFVCLYKYSDLETNSAIG